MRLLAAAALCLLIPLLSACGNGANNDASATAMLKLVGPETLAVGESAVFDLVLDGDPGSDFNGYNLHIVFDPAVLRVEDAKDVAFGDKGFCPRDFRNEEGQVTFACVLLGETTRISGVLAEVTIRGVAPGTTQLQLTAISPGEEMSPEAGTRTFLVRPTIEAGSPSSAAVVTAVESASVSVTGPR